MRILINTDTEGFRLRKSLDCFCPNPFIVGKEKGGRLLNFIRQLGQVSSRMRGVSFECRSKMHSIAIRCFKYHIVTDHLQLSVTGTCTLSAAFAKKICNKLERRVELSPKCRCKLRSGELNFAGYAHKVYVGSRQSLGNRDHFHHSLDQMPEKGRHGVWLPFCSIPPCFSLDFGRR